MVGVHAARKRPLNTLTPTFITTLHCYTSVESELNVALHKNPVSFTSCVTPVMNSNYSTIKRVIIQSI